MATQPNKFVSYDSSLLSTRDLRTLLLGAAVTMMVVWGLLLGQ